MHDNSIRLSEHYRHDMMRMKYTYVLSSHAHVQFMFITTILATARDSEHYRHDRMRMKYTYVLCSNASVQFMFIAQY